MIPETLRDTFKFHVVVGHKTVHRGITNDLDRVQAEMQRTWPASEVRQVGRKTTREQALRWERAGGRRPYRTAAHAEMHERRWGWLSRLWAVLR